MQTPDFLAPIHQRLNAFDRVISRRENVLSFLIVRFILMSGMVVGFTWWAFFHRSP